MELRTRKRKPFQGFTKAEIEKMEQSLNESSEQFSDPEFCKKLAEEFNCAKGRAKKPSLKWTEVQSWFENMQQVHSPKVTLPDELKKLLVHPEACPLDRANENSQIPKEVPDLSALQFEARSSKDGAWYDIEAFLDYRYRISGQAEVCVRFAGFGPKDDEWVNVAKAVRQRSIGLEHSECAILNIGDTVLCLQESKDDARYYDAYIMAIEKKKHDIRGCRCLFTIEYDHNHVEERVRLMSLYVRPNMFDRLKKN